MDFLSFAKAVYNNTISLKFIESKCVKNITCKFCKSKQIYIMKSRNQLRCKICKKDFKPFTNSKFPLVKISYSKWLALIKLFELSVSAKTASKQMQLDYKTTLRAFDTIRYSILEELAKSDRVLKGEIEADEAVLWRQKKGKSRSWCQKQNNCLWNLGEKWKGFSTDSKKCQSQNITCRNHQKGQERKYCVYRQVAWL